jgi:hypothetical protein
VLIKTLMNSQPPTSARRASKAMLEVNLEWHELAFQASFLSSDPQGRASVAANTCTAWLIESKARLDIYARPTSCNWVVMSREILLLASPVQYKNVSRVFVIFIESIKRLNLVDIFHYLFWLDSRKLAGVHIR